MGGRGGSSGGGSSSSGSYHPNNIIILDGDAGIPIDQDDPNIPDASRQKMETRTRREEQKHRYDDREFLTALDRTGKTIVQVQGDEHSVRVTPTDRQKLQSAKTITHNHPGTGGPLSYADFRTTLQFDIHEMRATDFQHTYVIRPGKGGWDAVRNKQITTSKMVATDGTVIQVSHPPMPFNEWVSNQVDSAARRAFDKVREIRTKNQASRTPNENIRTGNHMVKRYLDDEVHQTWKEISKVGGFNYSRITTRQRPRISGRAARRR